MHWTESYTFGGVANFTVKELLDDCVSEGAVAYSDSAVCDVGNLPDDLGIYAVIDLLTLLLYVGRGNIRKRWRGHFSELKRGRPSNFLMRRFLDTRESTRFAMIPLQLYPYDGDRLWGYRFRNLELQWAIELGAYDEERGFNLEAGNVRTPGSRFREAERRLAKRANYFSIREGNGHPYDPIPTALLRSWVQGLTIPDRLLRGAF